MSKHLISLILLTLGILCSPWNLSAEPQIVEDSEVAVGVLLGSQDQGIYGEIFQWPQGLENAFSAAEVDQSWIVQGFPVGPGERLRVQLQRYELYAQGSRTYVLSGHDTAPLEVPSTRRLHFRGQSLDDPGLHIALSFDPITAQTRGILVGPDGHRYEILDSPGEAGRQMLRHSRRAETEAGVELQAHCDADVLPGGTSSSSLSGLTNRRSSTQDLGDTILSAVVAIDTDNEFNHLKFSNNTTLATDYIADLFNEMNVMYERDLDLRLLIGDTFLRLDTDASPTYDDDPFNNTDTPASGAALNEFGTYWQNNQSSVDRVFAMLLSGKSSSTNVASGIAWVDGFCEAQSSGGGYSVNQIFLGNFPIVNDARLVGHELGHNHGSPHTHCYNPPVDECSSIGTGCYDGSNGFNCPGGGPGTVMSYCNFSASNCGQNRLEFHPTVINQIDGLITAHTFPGCLEPLVDPAEVFGDGFEAGSTSSWSTTVP